jgi:hypothetical protein
MARDTFNVQQFDGIPSFLMDIRQFNVKEEISEALHETLEEEFIPFICDKVKSRGLVGGPIDRGEGLRLSDEDAWRVFRQRNMRFMISVAPPTAERAWYLEYGTTGPITSNGAYPMKFQTNVSVPSEGASPGDTIYRYTVRGVKAYGFFRAAINEFDTVPRVEERLGREVNDRIKSALNIK